MIVTLFCFFFTTVIFIVLGKGAIDVYNKSEIKNYSLIDNYFIGLCVSGALLSIWSIFLPTNFFSFIFLAFLCVTIIFFNKAYYLHVFNSLFFKIKTNKTTTLLVIICLLLTLLFAVVKPQLYDTYLYHINTILWNEQFRTVPGLANFHERLGFNSSMLLLSACFSYYAIYNQFLFIISSLTFLLFFVWCIKTAFEKKGVVGLFLLLFIYFFISQYYLDISSPGTDLLPNILVSYLLLNIVVANENFKNKYLLFTILSLFCVTLKLSMFPITILGFLSLFHRLRKLWPFFVKIVFFCSLIILPWLIRNIITSGYLIFPLDSIDVFSFDWKVPVEKVIEMRKWIYSWGRVPFQDCDIVLNMPFNVWFKIWWKAAILKNKLFFVIAVVAPFTILFHKIVNKKRVTAPFVFSFLTAYIIFAFWLFTAPDIRFSFSVILFLALLPLFIFQKLIEKVVQTFNSLLNVTLICFLFLISNLGYSLFIQEYQSFKDVSKYVYLPTDIETTPERKNVKFTKVHLKTKKGEVIEFYEAAPKNGQCFDKFPCSCNIDSKLILRGENLRDGFKVLNN